MHYLKNITLSYLTNSTDKNQSIILARVLRTSIGVPAESQIQELFCSSVKFDHKISISVCIARNTNYGHPERASFEKFKTFGLGQTNWAEIFWGILGIFGQSISSILTLWVPCPWKNVAGSFSYKKLPITIFKGLGFLTSAIFLWLSFSLQKVWQNHSQSNELHNRLFHTLDLYLSHLKSNNECALTCQAT